ncbi:MAG: hypothetical protein HFG30_01970 [Eubacterium sp.]|jgi:3D (Asp-Asp-Asp) domain-containing protein|nr:hypothetical protein [Eubacterium sp.]
MKKTRLVIGFVLLTLTLVIAVIGSTMIVKNYTENKVAETQTTDKSVNKENVLKSDNKTDKLLANKTKKNTKTVSVKKQKIVLSSNEKAKKKSKKKSNYKKKKNKLKNIGTYKITGYCGCSSCCGKTDGVTASGTQATAGRTIAADTTKLPFGTKVVIDGHTYTVEDRGGAIKGNKIDVYFSSHSKALQWGVRYCDVYVAK